MQNISLLPNSTSLDTLGAYAVLALIADPEAAKKRLDELITEKQAAIDARAEASEVSRNANRDRQDAERLLADAQDLGEKNAARKKRLDEWEEKLKVTAKDLNMRESELAKASQKAKSEMDDHNTSMAQREKVVTDRLKAAEELMAQATEMKADYESKIDSLRKAVGTS